MKIVKRILLGSLGIIIGSVILLAGSIIVDFVIGRERINAITNTIIPGQNGAPDVRDTSQLYKEMARFLW